MEHYYRAYGRKHAVSFAGMVRGLGGRARAVKIGVDERGRDVYAIKSTAQPWQAQMFAGLEPLWDRGEV